MTVCIVFSPQLRQSTHDPRVTERLLESKLSALVLNRSSDRRPHPMTVVHASRGKKKRGGVQAGEVRASARHRERKIEREREGREEGEREREARRNG